MDALGEMTNSFYSWTVLEQLEKWLPTWLIKMFYPGTASKVRNGPKKLIQLVQKKIVEHRKTFNPNHKPRDIIDLYLKEKKGDQDFTDYRFACTLIFLMHDAIETTRTELKSCLFLLARHPGK